MISLENKVAVITGGANGIGKETVRKFLLAGANVVIWDIDAKKGEEAVKELNSEKVSFTQVDTTDLDDVMAAAKAAADRHGTIDFLINNAGITRDASMKKMTKSEWDQVINVNLTGVFNTTKAVFPYMEQNRSGRIINAASVVAHYGNFGQTNYVATKAGVIGMTKTWAREFGRKGINVNAVAPGFINTEMIKTVPEAIIDTLKQNTPLGRLGETEDIANAYLFLCSDMASFITGTVINVDGGLIM